MTSSLSGRVLAIGILIGVFLGGITPKAICAGDPCTDAETMAKQETNGFLWFGAGCLLGCLGVVGSYAIVPNPPASQIVGKPADYVLRYSECYKSEARSLQNKWAFIGCAAYLLSYVAYIYIMNIPLR